MNRKRNVRRIAAPSGTGAARGAAAASVLALALQLAGWGGVAAAGGPGEAVHRAVPGRTYLWDFQADTLGQKPAHSTEFGGVWEVAEDSVAAIAGDSTSASRAAAPRRLIRQTQDDDGIAYHYLRFTRPTTEDLDASVRFRIRAGELDPTAGILFQLDPKGTSGYLVRVSGKANELQFHYLLYGRRRDVRYVKVPPIEANTWHTLAISRRRSVMRASLDGTEVMMARDDRFSKGTIGLWTENDTKVDFADLKVVAR
jgi:hypothetical protein